MVKSNGYHITITRNLRHEHLFSLIENNEVFGFLELQVDAHTVVHVLLHYKPYIVPNDITLIGLAKITDTNDYSMVSAVSGADGYIAHFPEVLDIAPDTVKCVPIKQYPIFTTHCGWFEDESALNKFVEYFFIKTYCTRQTNGCTRLDYTVEIDNDDLFSFIHDKNFFIVGETSFGTYRKGPFIVKAVDDLNTLLDGGQTSNYSSNVVYHNQIIYIDIYPYIILTV